MHNSVFPFSFFFFFAVALLGCFRTRFFLLLPTTEGQKAAGSAKSCCFQRVLSLFLQRPRGTNSKPQAASLQGLFTAQPSMLVNASFVAARFRFAQTDADGNIYTQGASGHRLGEGNGRTTCVSSRNQDAVRRKLLFVRSLREARAFSTISRTTVPTHWS